MFPGDDKGHLKVNGIEFQRRIIEASKSEEFFFHGVRHIVESKLAELKVPPHIRDMLLDHAPARGSGAGYDHYECREGCWPPSNYGPVLSNAW
jgi:hypothetical protein